MPNPVSVLMILTVRYGKNGITNCVMNYVSRFDKARIRCDLVCPNEPGERARELIGQTGGEVFVLGGRNRRPTEYLKNLSRIIRERGEEIVHAHGNSATLYLEMLAAKRGGAKHRLPHSHNTTCKMKVTDRLLRGAFYRRYTGAVACSEAAGNWLFPNRPFTVLNNAVEADGYRFNVALRAKTRAAFDLAEDSFALMHIGAFNTQKNQAFLIGAFAKWRMIQPKARLLLVGDGEHRAACEALVKRLDIAPYVRFLGWREDVAALLSAADAFALPSLHEGLPLTLVEAQCAGLPCVVSDRVTREAALTELVAFCPIESEQAFAERLARLERTDRASASEAAIALVKEAGFDTVENAGRLMRFYEALTGRVG